MSRKVRVVIDASNIDRHDDTNKYESNYLNIKVQDNIRIITKSFNYKIPVKAILTTDEGFKIVRDNYRKENRLNQFTSCGNFYDPEKHKQKFNSEIKLPPLYEKLTNRRGGDNQTESHYNHEDTNS